MLKLAPGCDKDLFNVAMMADYHNTEDHTIAIHKVLGVTHPDRNPDSSKKKSAVNQKFKIGSMENVRSRRWLRAVIEVMGTSHSSEFYRIQRLCPPFSDSWQTEAQGPRLQWDVLRLSA